MSGYDSLLEQLHDIEGLDPISAWPLAIGYWIVLGLGIVILLLAMGALIKWYLFRRSWKYDTLEKLNDLLRTLAHPSVTKAEIQNTAVLFSEYLRRIALRRFSRKTCAALTGEAWLKWLSEHDVKKFDWVREGELLVHVPYVPAEYELPDLTVEKLKTLILAAKEWVK